MPWTIDEFQTTVETIRKLENHSKQLRTQCQSYRDNMDNSGPLTTAVLLSRAQGYAAAVNNALDLLQANQSAIQSAIVAVNGNYTDFTSRFTALRDSANALVGANEGNLSSRVDAILAGL